MADIIRALTEAVKEIGIQNVLIVGVILAAVFMALALWRLTSVMQHSFLDAIKANTESNIKVANELQEVKAVALCKYQPYFNTKGAP